MAHQPHTMRRSYVQAVVEKVMIAVILSPLGLGERATAFGLRSVSHVGVSHHAATCTGTEIDGLWHSTQSRHKARAM